MREIGPARQGGRPATHDGVWPALLSGGLASIGPAHAERPDQHGDKPAELVAKEMNRNFAMTVLQTVSRPPAEACPPPRVDTTNKRQPFGHRRGKKSRRARSNSGSAQHRHETGAQHREQ